MKWIKNDNIANEGNTKEKKSRERWIELKKKLNKKITER